MHLRLSGLVRTLRNFLCNTFHTFSIWEGIPSPTWPQIFLRHECGLADKGVSWRGHTNGVYLSELSWHTCKTQASPQLQYRVNAVEDLKLRNARKWISCRHHFFNMLCLCKPSATPFKYRQSAHSRNVVTLLNV